ncbi:hypothetical protein D3C72_1611810 [compost metagenome]
MGSMPTGHPAFSLNDFRLSNSPYSSSPMSFRTGVGRSSPSVWLTSNTGTGRNETTNVLLGSTSSAAPPSSASASGFGLKVLGARIHKAFSPFLTCRPSFCQVLNPATLVASGHWAKSSMVLEKLYWWKAACIFK